MATKVKGWANVRVVKRDYATGRTSFVTQVRQQDRWVDRFYTPTLGTAIDRANEIANPWVTEEIVIMEPGD